MTCPWTAVVPLGDGRDYSAFDAGHQGANAWLRKAGDPDTLSRVRTHFLVCGDVNCGFYSMKQIVVRGRSESCDEVAALVVWLALDKTHHGARLGKRLMLEVLAACVEAANVTPFRYIMLDLADDAEAHVGSLYEGAGFTRRPDGRYRMKISLARSIIATARANGVTIVSARSPQTVVASN